MGKKGLTLLEVILVMAIIAIAASMAIPNFQGTLEKKRADSAIAALRKISHCIRLYKLENGGTLPAGGTFAALDTDTGNGCFDTSQFEDTYAFPAPADPIDDAAGVMAQDSQSSRMVCLVPAGASDGSGMVYDFSTAGAGCVSGRSDEYRHFPE